MYRRLEECLEGRVLMLKKNDGEFVLLSVWFGWNLEDTLKRLSQNVHHSQFNLPSNHNSPSAF